MSKPYQHNGFIGQSPVFMAMLARLEKIAAYDTSVLITGETGSGKEIAARAIHYHSARRDKPFIPVNCGAMPDHLIENELFGHARGAYTDARDSQQGLVSQADGGTLFLDEVDTLSIKAQVCLLRFLQDGQFRALGSSNVAQANVRILAATNADLIELIEAGGFRQDLHFRLNAMEIHIPPLRERGDDILLLARHFISEAARQYDLQEKDIHPETQHWLTSQSWPGNIRQLQHLIQREFLLSENGLVHIEPVRMAVDRRRQPDRRKRAASTLNFNDEKQRIIDSFERDHLIHLMRAASGNVSHAARLAGKERRSLGKLLKKHDIEPSRFRPS
jgi:DNA-binding NtrC family response regulator